MAILAKTTGMLVDLVPSFLIRTLTHLECVLGSAINAIPITALKNPEMCMRAYVRECVSVCVSESVSEVVTPCHV